MRFIDADAINISDTIGGKNDFADCIRDSVQAVLNNASTVLTIPKNPTNGDMIKAMFPNAEIECGSVIDENCEFFKIVYVKYNGHSAWVHYELDWWNAPYKAESEGTNGSN